MIKMKKILAVLLTFILAFSAIAVTAFAEDVYTCPTCEKKYESTEDYNACIDSHADDSESHIGGVFTSLSEVFDALIDVFEDGSFRAAMNQLLNQIKSYVEEFIDVATAYMDAVA